MNANGTLGGVFVEEGKAQLPTGGDFAMLPDILVRITLYPNIAFADIGISNLNLCNGNDSPDRNIFKSRAVSGFQCYITCTAGDCHSLGCSVGKLKVIGSVLHGGGIIRSLFSAMCGGVFFFLRVGQGAFKPDMEGKCFSCIGRAGNGLPDRYTFLDRLVFKDRRCFADQADTAAAGGAAQRIGIGLRILIENGFVKVISGCFVILAGHEIVGRTGNDAGFDVIAQILYMEKHIYGSGIRSIQGSVCRNFTNPVDIPSKLECIDVFKGDASIDIGNVVGFALDPLPFAAAFRNLQPFQSEDELLISPGGTLIDRLFCNKLSRVDVGHAAVNAMPLTVSIGYISVRDNPSGAGSRDLRVRVLIRHQEDAARFIDFNRRGSGAVKHQVLRKITEPCILISFGCRRRGVSGQSVGSNIVVIVPNPVDIPAVPNLHFIKDHIGTSEVKDNHLTWLLGDFDTTRLPQIIEQKISVQINCRVVIKIIYINICVISYNHPGLIRTAGRLRHQGRGNPIPLIDDGLHYIGA